MLGFRHGLWQASCKIYGVRRLNKFTTKGEKYGNNQSLKDQARGRLLQDDIERLRQSHGMRRYSLIFLSSYQRCSGAHVYDSCDGSGRGVGASAGRRLVVSRNKQSVGVGRTALARGKVQTSPVTPAQVKIRNQNGLPEVDEARSFLPRG